jgi:hypothetical protein
MSVAFELLWWVIAVACALSSGEKVESHAWSQAVALGLLSIWAFMQCAVISLVRQLKAGKGARND